MHHRAVNMSGQRFGRLVALEPMHVRSGGAIMWKCVCDCGKTKEILGPSLRSGATQSCGCLRRELVSTHRMTNSAEYGCWEGIIQRCNNPSSKNFRKYGGRGIKVCERWSSFEDFYSDMGPRPSASHSIERIDNDGNYEPSNCRWATRHDQLRNTRRNRVIKAFGKTGPLVDFIPEGPNSNRYHMVRLRLKKGWEPESALSIPPTERSKRRWA